MKEKKEIQNNIHDLKNLIQPGVSNTELVFREYQFTDGNEFDYTADIADLTTVTFNTPGKVLPTNTISILVMLSVSNTGSIAGCSFRRKNGGPFAFGSRGTWADGGTNIWADTVEIPTYQNSIYVETLWNTCNAFKIYGYKVKV